MSSQATQDVRLRLVSCTDCRGSGWIIRDLDKPAERCSRCAGKGKNEKVAISISEKD